MKPSCKVIFFGNERLSSGFSPNGAPTLQALIDNGYNVAAVVAHHEQATSRKARSLEIQQVAEQRRIPVLLPQKLSEASADIAAFGAGIGVLVAYGKIIPQSIIDLFPKGIVNIHPSLLPKYRGSTPIEQAILDGANETGVSLMQLVKQMDAGPIYAQAKITLKGSETKQRLTTTLLQKGAEMLIKNLPHILDGSLHPTPQDESQATFTRLLTKADSRLDFTKPATQLEREVRAFAGWPKSRATIFGHDVVVTEARIAAHPTDGSLVISAGQQTYLEITTLTAPSGRNMSGADFIRGYKK